MESDYLIKPQVISSHVLYKNGPQIFLLINKLHEYFFNWHNIDYGEQALNLDKVISKTETVLDLYSLTLFPSSSGGP